MKYNANIQCIMQRIDNSDSEIHCEYMSICNNMEFLLLLQVLPKKLKL